MQIEIFTPGRTELAGNHTDHQKGRVMAAAVDFGIHALCSTNDGAYINIRSEGFEPFRIKLSASSVRTSEFGTPNALVRGVLAAFKDLGLNVGGFDAQIRSTLPPGSGMSSSAAFSVLIGKIFSELYNGGEVDPVVIARAAQQAENRHFGKPCGIMDQLACSLGKTVYADLATNEIVPLSADFAAMGLTLCLTNTGGSHAGLGTSYARIPADMAYIANLFNKGTLSEVDPKDFFSKGWDPANRPVRRAMHFFGENERVWRMRDALIQRDGESYMRLMNESGRSSENLLNNIVTSATGDTLLLEGLQKSEKLLKGIGAWRVHGGGFAGCVQALMPSDYYASYKCEMERDFGKGSCFEVKLI